MSVQKNIVAVIVIVFAFMLYAGSEASFAAADGNSSIDYVPPYKATTIDECIDEEAVHQIFKGIYPQILKEFKGKE